MNPTQRQLIKEAYQEGYYQALEENLGKRIGNYLGKKLGGLLKNLFKGKRRGLINPGGQLPEPNDATPFKKQADILFNKLLNSLNTDIDNYYQDLGSTGIDMVDKIGISIDDLFYRVQAGELTNSQAIAKLMQRHPAFFDNFGTSTGSRFDDLPGLDP